jgi:hypothetical protein
VLHLLSLATPRACPRSLNSPAPLLLAAKAPLSITERAHVDAQPLPQSGNLIGALAILKKTGMELSAGTLVEAAASKTRFAALQTRGDARAYAASVMDKVGIAIRQREAAKRRAHMRRRPPIPIAPPQTEAVPAAMRPATPVPAVAPPQENVIEVVLTSGERLRIPPDPATLRMVLAVLRERPPR